MATAIAHPSTSAKPAPTLPGRRYDNYFFMGMGLLMAATVFVGFAPSYYLAGVFRAPLPSTIVHVHGAVFTAWILFFIAQTSLVSTGRVDIHRKLGLFGFFWACLMVIVGVMAATDSLVRGAGPVGRDVKFFYIIPLSDMLVFAPLIYFAYRARRDPATHKRLILVATIDLLIAAIARWPVAYVHRNAMHAGMVSCLFLVMLIAYDLWSTHKVHRATLWASALMVFVYAVRIPIGKTQAWHAFASWVQSVAR
jgi:FtsH-binding integral membrane protein